MVAIENRIFAHAGPSIERGGVRAAGAGSTMGRGATA
jgi:hypothetical protein